MAQRFKAKTLLSNSGVFNNEVIAPNLVYNTGTQSISGIKIFVGSLGLGNSNNPNNNKLYFYDTGTASYNTIQTYSDNGASYTIFELSDQGSTNQISIDLVSKTISGANNSAINFSNRPTANGTGILLSGEAASLPATIVYTTGNQTISGIKSFATGIDIINSGNPQNLRVFNRTGINSGEFGIFGWTNNQLIIGAQQTNSGILRNIIFTGANININPISGSLTVNGSGIFSLSGITPLNLPNNPLSIVGSGNNYLQLNIQNRGTGNNASADLVITANNGTDSTNFINLGINNSGYNDPAFTNGTGFDGYLFIDGGDLDIGTRTSGKAIEFHAGGATQADTIARISSSGLNIVSGGLQISGISVIPSSYATVTSLASTGLTLQTNINNLSGTSVQTFGNQNISGNKTFFGNIVINNLTVTGTESIVNTSNVNIGSNFLLLNVTGGGGVHGPATDGGIFFITGSGLTGINDTGAILGYDSPANKWIFGIGTRSNDLSTLNEIASVPLVTALSGMSVFTTGNQTVSGLKTFSNGIISNIGVTGTNLVYNSGNQTINGLKTFTSGIDIYSGTNPQSLRIFNSTGTNSGEFGLIGWRNNQLVIGSQQSQSGILRDVVITGNNININASGVLNIFDPVNISGNVTITGHLSASSKSFLIDHPTQLGKKLQYGSLEGPEHGVFVRGKTSDTTINLPNYWASLVDENSISVNLTPIDIFSNIYVVDYNNIRIIIDGNNGNDYFYTVYGERKDIPKLTVEF
jgi:hypothetical protein